MTEQNIQIKQSTDLHETWSQELQLGNSRSGTASGAARIVAGYAVGNCTMCKASDTIGRSSTPGENFIESRQLMEFPS